MNLVVNKYVYGLRLPVLNKKILQLNEPQRGEVVVFRHPPNPKVNYIKRVVGVPGDRDVDLKRIGGQLEPVLVEQAGPEDLAKAPALVKGYIGPQRLAEAKIRYLVDPLVVPNSAWVTGANAEGKHAAFVTRGRDFTPDGEIGAVEIPQEAFLAVLRMDEA